MFVVTRFDNNGVPAIGLSPLIRIRDIETGNVVVSGTMSEIGDGFYKYEFFGYDISKEYAILCDSVSLTGDNRYKFLATEEYGDVIETVALINDNIDLRTLLLRKILTNRLELVDGSTNNWILYDDNDTDVLTTWDVTDQNNDVIIEPDHGSSRRSKGY